jgi:hypothetical protein
VATQSSAAGVGRKKSPTGGNSQLWGVLVAVHWPSILDLIQKLLIVAISFEKQNNREH